MVGIVILNFNNSAQTLSCVETLVQFCPSQQWKLCVVDNASREKEYAKLEELKSLCPEELGLKIIRSEVNGGYAQGNNLGCRWFEGDADVDKILILNDDTRFIMDIIGPMERYLDEHAECGVVFPLVKAADGSVDKACLRRQKSVRDLVLQATSLRLPRHEFIPVEALQPDGDLGGPGNFGNLGAAALPESFVTEVPPGSCMMLRKSFFKEIGYLDPHTFLYFEEHILAAKLLRQGKTCVLLPRLNIVHLGAQTTKNQPSKAVYGHWRDSYLYFMKEYSTVCRPLQFLLRLRTGIKLNLMK